MPQEDSTEDTKKEISTCWKNTDGSQSIRIYITESNGRVSEKCCDGGQWYNGAFKEWGQAVTATSWLEDYIIHIRVYLQLKGFLQEYCWDGAGWNKGWTTKTDLEVATSESWRDNKGTHLRIRGDGIKFHYDDGIGWTKSTDPNFVDKDDTFKLFAKTEPVSKTTKKEVSISWKTSSGSESIRTYFDDNDGKVSERCTDGGPWYIGAFRVSGCVVTATSWLENYDIHIRVYVQLKGYLQEHCWDGAGWVQGWSTKSEIDSATSESWRDNKGTHLRIKGAGIEYHYDDGVGWKSKTACD